VAPRASRRVREQSSVRRSGPAKPLTRGGIVEAALAIVDEEGLEALSMRRLAAALGADPMAFYNHLPNKAALYDAIVEAIVVDIEVPAAALSLPLGDFFLLAGRAFRESLLRHPRAVSLLATRPLATPIGMRAIDAMLGVFVKAGFTPAEGLAAMDNFSAFVIACVQRQAQAADESGPDPHRNLEEMKEVLTPPDFPNLGRAMAEGKLMDFQSEFEFGLEAFARGLSDIAAGRARG
jgi:TetR/AcrR family transcriptional regulator, tetracycline repressor protein